CFPHCIAAIDDFGANALERQLSFDSADLIGHFGHSVHYRRRLVLPDRMCADGAHEVQPARAITTHSGKDDPNCSRARVTSDGFEQDVDGRAMTVHRLVGAKTATQLRSPTDGQMIVATGGDVDVSRRQRCTLCRLAHMCGADAIEPLCK